jgi:hypothetical protein
MRDREARQQQSDQPERLQLRWPDEILGRGFDRKDQHAHDDTEALIGEHRLEQDEGRAAHIDQTGDGRDARRSGDPFVEQKQGTDERALQDGQQQRPGRKQRQSGQIGDGRRQDFQGGIGWPDWEKRVGQE